MRLSKARKACVTAMMRDTIFEAASSVLDQHGAGGLTMDRVASTVGVATGSLYNYFHNENDLLQFFYTRLVEPFFQPIEEIVKTELSAPQKLEKIVRAAREHAVKRKGLIRLFFGNGSTRRDTKRRSSALLADSYNDFRAGRSGGFVPSAQPRAFGPHVSRLFVGVVRDAGGRRIERGGE